MCFGKSRECVMPPPFISLHFLCYSVFPSSRSLSGIANGRRGCDDVRMMCIALLKDEDIEVSEPEIEDEDEELEAELVGEDAPAKSEHDIRYKDKKDEDEVTHEASGEMCSGRRRGGRR